MCANSAKAVRLCTVCIIFSYVLSCSAAAGTVNSILIYACAGSGTTFGMSTHTKLNICMWEAIIGRAQSQEARTKKEFAVVSWLNGSPTTFVFT